MPPKTKTPSEKTKGSKRKRNNSTGSDSDDKKPAALEEDDGSAQIPDGGIALDKAPIEDLEAAAPAVYFPDFYPEIPTMTQEDLKARDWLTPELVTEIQQYFPSEHDIQGPDGVRKKEALARQMEELFPLERKFASWKQLQQALTMLSRPWGFNSSHTTSKLICSFGKKTSDTSYVSKGLRKRGPSAKDLIQCPFEIRYAYCGYGRVARFEKLPSLRYQVKITGADYNHTCGLSPASRQLALRMSKKLGSPKEKKEGDNKKKDDKTKQMPSVAYAVSKNLEAAQAAANVPPGFASISLATLEALQTSYQQRQPVSTKTIKPDRPSRFRLDAFGGFQHQPMAAQPVLNVEAPIQNGEILWKIGYCFTITNSQGLPENNGAGVPSTGMDTVAYAQDNISAVANFINGFLSSMGGTAHKVELNEGQKKLCQWWLPITTNSAAEDLTKARLEIITGALRTLMTEDSGLSNSNNNSLVI